MQLNWKGKPYRYIQNPVIKVINPDVAELMRPLGEKRLGQAILTGEFISGVQDEGPAPTPSITPSVSPTPNVTPSVTPTLTPTPSQTPPPPWTPASLSNLWDWWKASSGASLDANNGVTGWTGYNSNVLEPYNNSYLAEYISSDSTFGNQPSLLFNSGSTNIDCGYYINTSTQDTSKTIILVGYLVAKETNQINPLAAINPGGFPRFGIWGENGNNTYWCYINTGGGDVAFNASTTYVDSTYQFIRIDYDRSSGNANYYTSTANTFTNLINTNSDAANADFDNGRFTVLSYSGGYGETPKMKLVEVIFIDGIPSGTELTNLSTYLTNTYGI